MITRPEESYRLWRVVVLSRNLDNEEAKVRYRAVKIQPQWVVTPGKQTNKHQVEIVHRFNIAISIEKRVGKCEGTWRML
jgi:hypothetical protein